MKRWSKLLFFLLVVALGGFVWFHEFLMESRAERGREVSLAFRVDVDRTQRIRIRRPEYEVELHRSGEGWVLSSPRDAPAHDAMVRQTLSRLRALEQGDLITPADMRERGQTLADFGLDVPSAVFVLEDSRGEREYRVGNPNPLGTELFVKEAAGHNIMLVSSDLLDILPRSADALRDRRLLTLSPGSVATLSLVDPRRVLRLERQGAAWKIVEPGSYTGDVPAVLNLIERISLARIEHFPDTPNDTAAELGLSPPLYEIRAHDESGQRSMELWIGNPVPGAPGQRYARFAGRDGVFVVSEGIRNIASTEFLALMDRRLFPLDPEGLRGVRLKGPSDRVELEARLGTRGWRLVAPRDRPASDARMQGFLEALLQAQVEEILPFSQADPTLFTVEIETVSGSLHSPKAFRVLDAPSLPGSALLRPVGREEVWRVVPDTIRYLSPDPVHLLSRDMLSFRPAEVIRISRRQGELAERFTREEPEGPWVSLEEGMSPRGEAIERIVNLASSLRADAMVALAPPSLEPFHLEEPAFRISFGLRGDDPGNRTLLLAPDPGGDRVLATVLGSDVVFSLTREDASPFFEPIASREPEDPDGEEDLQTETP